MHFANELTANGNEVYFVNPPSPDSRSTDLAYINKNAGLENITVINLKPVKNLLFFRHKLPIVFSFISRRYAKEISKLVGGPIDEVWCFNPHLFSSLKHFHAKRNYLLLYDFYKGNYIDKLVTTSDKIISVSKLILDHYKTALPPKLFVQHGLSRQFAGISETKIKTNSFSEISGSRIRIGYVGNLLREGMDVEIATKIIEENQDKEFHFWGPHSAENNNVAHKSMVIKDEQKKFIEFLQSRPNVFLRGIKPTSVLASEINEMDCFLFLYCSDKDSNKASNSHKIMEYLSTGKSIISTYVSNYEGTDLLIMCEPDNTSSLPALVKKVTGNLSFYNNAENQRKRISFALDNTYARQIERIRNFS
jgi:hypothetical protein